MKFVLAAVIWVAWFTFWNENTDRRMSEEEAQQEQTLEEDNAPVAKR
jgi:hypothetical protein